ncbi:hypothetical protein C1M56_11680 [Vibrio diazotrophicus]|nr:hypothetical protein C1M56_11680 [Vibrio diazotrophicus]
MHKSAMNWGRRFFETYSKETEFVKILEIGSLDVNGSLKDAISINNYEYIGVDFSEGKNVDVVLENPYIIPLDDNSFDIIVSSSCFEHSEFFWVSWLEILRILKPGGLIYINVPSNGYIHRYPVDCWRFYPDSGLALQNWGRFNGYPLSLLESFISKQQGTEDEERWNDFVAVFSKTDNLEHVGDSRIVNSCHKYEVENIILDGKNSTIQFSLPQDFDIQNDLFVKCETTLEANAAMQEKLSSLEGSNNELLECNIELKDSCELLSSMLDKLNKDVDSIEYEKKLLSEELSYIRNNKFYKILKRLDLI